VVKVDYVLSRIKLIFFFFTFKTDFRPDKETEIFHDDATSVFHYPWEFQHISTALRPNGLTYQNENLFALHVFEDGSEHPWIHLICANNHNFGFKAAKAFCSMDYYGAWMEMKPTRADVMELILFATQGSGSLEKNSRDRRADGYSSYSCFNLYFRIEMTSSIENYHYEMMDTSWTTQLWQAALNQQLTDVEIIVGPNKIKLEAHRVILSARSPVLSALLDNNDQVKSSIVIDENMHINVVKHFLKFLYTGCLEISATNKQLLELSKIYEVETLMKICQVANCISPDVTSKLDASQVDVNPYNTFRKNLDIVADFSTFLRCGHLNTIRRINIRQLTALAEMYELGTLKRICELNRNVPLDIDEVATFLLTTL
jgi:speckle-type POZ protein